AMTTTAKQERQCLCGCGEATFSKWRVGHDARYHGAERKVKQGVLPLSDFRARFPAETIKQESPGIEKQIGTLAAPQARTSKPAPKPKAKPVAVKSSKGAAKRARSRGRQAK